MHRFRDLHAARRDLHHVQPVLLGYVPGRRVQPGHPQLRRLGSAVWLNVGDLLFGPQLRSGALPVRYHQLSVQRRCVYDGEPVLCRSMYERGLRRRRSLVQRRWDHLQLGHHVLLGPLCVRPLHDQHHDVRGVGRNLRPDDHLLWGADLQRWSLRRPSWFV